MIATIKIAYRLRLLAVAAVCGLLWSCDADREIPGGKGGSNSYVSGIAAFIVTRADDNAGESSDNDGGDETDSDGDSTDFNIDVMEPPYSLKFDENTVLQVSQKGPDSKTPFQSIPTYDYQYNTSYKEPEDGSAWDNDNCYNFTPSVDGEQLEWNKIIGVGSVNGTYAMYGLYFPEENHIRFSKNETNGAIYYYVHSDQSDLKKLKASDILGAFHTTRHIFERIRFKLHHLMTYLRIRLYVPVYDDVKHTGYREGSLLYATLDGANPYFTIEWDAVLATEDPLKITPVADGVSSIKMYQHPLPDGATQHPLAKIKYKDYIPAVYPNQGIDGDYDEVRVYDFSVIIPKQLANEENGSSSFTDNEFLNFYLRTNSGATTRYYFTQTNKGTMNPDDEKNEFDLNQGVFQCLHLYLPRVGNQVVFMGAKVNPWNHTNTEMFLETDQVEQ